MSATAIHNFKWVTITHIGLFFKMTRVVLSSARFKSNNFLLINRNSFRHSKLEIVFALPALVSEYCFTSLSAQSWQYRDRRKPDDETMPSCYFEWFQGFFILHSTIVSTEPSRLLNKLEHCICTTTMTNIRSNDSSLVPPGYKPQPIVCC